VNILLTGGTGYIGSHTSLTLNDEDNNVILYDNLTNSNQDVNNKLRAITGKTFSFIEGDIRDTQKLIKTFKDYQVEAVIHLAGKKSVAESVTNPIDYYDNNVAGTISVLKAIQDTKLKNLVFSSSATVYGEPQYLPLDEDHPMNPTNPYGRSKLQVENILYDFTKTNPSFNVACLRYFNPVGAHKSGLIGENPRGTPNNLMPHITQVAVGKRPNLNIFGNDYNTHDGTGIRDYIHVMDVAEGHLAGLKFITRKGGWHSINLGSGKGFSVLELLKTFEGATNKIIPYTFSKRRLGDVESCFSDVSKAKLNLNWEAKRSLSEMCISAWKFEKLNSKNSH
jgi:UDP-glucose 4-epimerase